MRQPYSINERNALNHGIYQFDYANACLTNNELRAFYHVDLTISMTHQLRMIEFQINDIHSCQFRFL